MEAEAEAKMTTLKSSKPTLGLPDARATLKARTTSPAQSQSQAGTT